MPPRREALNDYPVHRKADTTSTRTTPSKPLLIDAELTMEYATLDARIASFQPATKKSKTKWPHKRPSPDDLAKAGFYWKPTSSKDNVICFVCERSLDGWEPNDDPIAEHLKHGGDCPWATLAKVAMQQNYDLEDMEDPTDIHLTEARRQTFENIADGWPHENKRGWTCKIEKMVEGGWHFAPTTECEDYVSCTYCKLSLDGWEPKDNPFEEHYRRSPECPFFHFAGTTPPNKRPKAKKGRASKTSRTSKASSRLSTQSNSMMSNLDESTGNFEVLGVDTTMEDSAVDAVENSIISIQSTTSTATTKGKRKAPARAKGAAAKKAKTTKGKKKQEPTEEELDAQLEVELEIMKREEEEKAAQASQVQEMEVEQPKPKAKKGGRKKKKEPTPEPEPEVEEASVEEVQIVEVHQQEPEPEPIQEKPKRKISKGKKASQEIEPKPESQILYTTNIGEPEAQGTQAEETHQDDEPSYPILPDRSPTADFEDAPEMQEPQVEESTTPQATPMQTGPPEKETTPIPAKQTSPLKETSNPPRPMPSPAQVIEAQKRRSSRRSKASQRDSGYKSKEPTQDQQPQEQPHSRSPSQPSDLENRPPSSLPKETRPPLSSPGAPPPQWTPVDIENVFKTVDDEELDVNIFEGLVNGVLSEAEKDMTVQQWIEYVAGRAESRLSAEGEKIVSVFEREGRRAMTALENIQCV